MLDIKKYEAIAKLDLPEDERATVLECADLLIRSFDLLKNVDTSGVEPLVSVLEMQNVLRDDVCVKQVSREELLSNAPEQYDGYFQVPKTLD